MVIFTLSAGNEIRNYKYSCIDSSPFSKYLMHPFWNQVVKLCPRSIAPNSLTLAGFMFTIFHYLLLTYFNPTMQTPQQTPSIAYLICAVFVFMAHTLDGIDGKQARRTSSSSALGEIFDHGCDAWVAVMLPCSTMCIFGLELSPLMMFHIQVLGCFGFVFSHWEKYITDILYLPWVFDVSQVVFALIFVVASNPVLNAIISHKVMVDQISSFILLAFWCLVMPSTIVRCLFFTKKRPDIRYWHYVSPILDTCIVILASYIWILFFKCQLLQRNPRLFLFTFGTVLANVTLRVMASQLGRMEIRPFSPLALLYLGTILVQLLVSQFSYFTTNFPLWDLYLLALACFFIVVLHVKYSIQLIKEFCTILNIRPFAVTGKAKGS